MKLTLIEYSYCCVTATIALIININRHVGSGKWDVVNDPYSGYKLTCSDSEDLIHFPFFTTQFFPITQNITILKCDVFICKPRDKKNSFLLLPLKIISICVPHFNENSYVFAAYAR